MLRKLQKHNGSSVEKKNNLLYNCKYNMLLKGLVRMKKFKKHIAFILSTIAMVIASTASTMCFFFFFEEPKMPESLYKKD